MELRNIVTFSKIASLESYSKAAESLGYSPSALTAQIKNLENELNVKLIEKNGRGIKLTEKGKVFLKYANKISELITESIEELNDDNKPKGILKIGVTESVCNIKLPRLLEIFHEKYPDVTIELKVGICSKIREMLKKNMVDIIIVIDQLVEDDDFIVYYKAKEEIGVLSAPNNKIVKNKSISIKNLNNQSLVLTEKGCTYRKRFEKILNDNSIETDTIMESGSIEAVKNFIKGNIGIGVLPIIAVKKELESGELVRILLNNCKFNMFTQVVYNKDKYITNSMRVFLELIKKMDN